MFESGRGQDRRRAGARALHALILLAALVSKLGCDPGELARHTDAQLASSQDLSFLRDDAGGPDAGDGPRGDIGTTARDGVGQTPDQQSGVPDLSRESGAADSFVPAVAHFIGPAGVDNQDCSGGTRQSPWKTYNANAAKGCIQPGEAVYFLQGTYRANTPTFGNGFVIFAGQDQKPILLAADPQATAEVRFEGYFNFEGRWGIVSRINFYSKNSQQNYGAVVKLSGEHITLKDCLVDGSEQGNGGFDCIKILSGKTPSSRTRQIAVIGCEVHHCPEDVIDVTGAKEVLYRDNNMHHFNSLQVKGGTEDIVIEQNYLHTFSLGIRGAGMACSDYCGNPDLPLMAVKDRFVAKNVTIRNNIFRASTGWDVVGAHGWQGVQIYHNTFYDHDKVALILGDKSGLQFFDPIAEAYCKADPERCTSCGSGCWKITFIARDVQFKNNIVAQASGTQIYILEDSMANELEASHNIYDPAAGQSIEFRVGGQNYTLANFPLETGSSKQQDPMLVAPAQGDFLLQAASPAINTGLPLGVALDFAGKARDSAPDIGALEH